MCAYVNACFVNIHSIKLRIYRVHATEWNRIDDVIRYIKLKRNQMWKYKKNQSKKNTQYRTQCIKWQSLNVTWNRKHHQHTRATGTTSFWKWLWHKSLNGKNPAISLLHTQRAIHIHTYI